MSDGCSKAALKKHRAQVKKALGKGLMFVDAILNGKPMKNVMINTSTTYNFVSDVEACCLGLKLEKDVGRMKAMNSKGIGYHGVSQTSACKDWYLRRDDRFDSNENE